MKKLLCCLIILTCCIFETGYSQNLVPNGDFETYNFCPPGIGHLIKAIGWNVPLEDVTPDYFNSCAMITSWVDVPANRMGNQIARSGQGYAGLIVAMDPPNPVNKSYREYIQCQLTQPLIAGEEYFLQFYVSLGDSSQISSNEFGAYFSTVYIQDTCPTMIPCNLAYVPQIENVTNNSLFDRINWIQISGSFVASGGEEYLILGNFKDSTNTPYQATGWAPNWQVYCAYFYVDDVCLSSDSLYCPSLTSLNNINSVDNLSIYPNPANDYIHVTGDGIESLKIYDISGRLVKSVSSPVPLTIDIRNLPEGMYPVAIETRQGTFYKKVVVSR